MYAIKTEEEIIQNWKDGINHPIVSIICVTYNHHGYIEDAIRGFLIQETNFSFEILIHDDASTDGTADIIRKYEKQYPNIIKPIYQIRNQYSKGIKPGQVLTRLAKGNILQLVKEMIIGLIQQNYKSKLTI